MRRRKRWLHLPHDHGEPIARPRYDVVAGVLFAVAGMLVWTDYPVPTHATTFELPVNNYFGQPFEPWPESVATHLLTLTPDGQIVWNGEPTTYRSLLDALEQAVAANPREGIIYEPHAYASFESAAKLMTVLVRTGATDERFCLGGLRQYANTADEADGRRYLHSVRYPLSGHRPRLTPIRWKVVTKHFATPPTHPATPQPA